MLVVTRRPRETVICRLSKPMAAGTEIIFSVVSIDGNKAFVGISADSSISIRRNEVETAMVGAERKYECQDCGFDSRMPLSRCKKCGGRSITRIEVQVSEPQEASHAN